MLARSRPSIERGEVSRDKALRITGAASDIGRMRARLLAAIASHA